MKFNPIEIQRIDSTGNFKPDEYYILSYLYSDGWTERSLSANFYIDIYCNSKIEFNFSKWNTVKEFLEKFEFQIEIETPIEIKTLILELVNQEELQLNYNYSDFFLEDSNKEHFVLNHGNQSHNVGIGILLNKPTPKNKSEEIFFNLYAEFKDWKETLYSDLLSSELL